MSKPSSVTSAIEAWKQELGAASVMDDEDSLNTYTRAACGSSRQVFAALFPKNHEQVERIVAIANEFLTPLYPISRGKQWGMGSKLPVRDGAAIVDLSGMDRIIEVNEPFHYAVVEPGVTQRQLIDHIRDQGLDLMLNVTGSTSDTSLIGNAMDRGVGYFDSRAHGISNMTVVLGSGRTIQTGFGHYENAKTKNLYPYGVGPSLDGLFPQGNFGIVTSACIDLMPAPSERMTAALTIKSENDLPRLVDALVELRKLGAIETVAHVGNKERSHITFAPLVYEALIAQGETPGPELRASVRDLLKKSEFGPWTAGIGMLGTRRQLALSKKMIRTKVSSFAKVTFLTDAFLSRAKTIAGLLSFIPYFKTRGLLLSAIGPVYGFTQGETTDTSLKTMYWPSKDYENLNLQDPDQSNSGTLFCLPIIPAEGNVVESVVTKTRKLFQEYGFEAAMTVNLMNSKAMEGVISLAFDRRDAQQSATAHNCIAELEKACMEMGLPPYRVGINSMGAVVKADDTFWETISGLKKALDPNMIMAPGRYNLT